MGPVPGVRLGIFGTFRPQPKAGALTTGIVSFSTGVVAALARDDRVESITVFSQTGSDRPSGESWSRVSVTPCWSYDDPVSLLRSIRVLRARSSQIDGFLFDTAITDFGRSALANVIGLLLPPAIAALTRKPVATYAHYFLETQDPVQLGYRPTLWQRWGVRLLERLLLAGTRVVVPLESQRATIEREFGIAPRQLFIPFAEPFGWLAARNGPLAESPIPPDEPMRILLLGAWGPQKDLPGVFRAILSAKQRGADFTVSVTGAINPHFPEYRQVLDRVAFGMNHDWIRFLGPVPEARLLDVVRGHDLMILPYNAAGGYSSSMSVATYCGIQIISYDLPQLREVARELGTSPTFVVKGDTEGLVQEILATGSDIRRLRQRRAPVPRPALDLQTCQRAGELLGVLGLEAGRGAPQ
jgi:glycosyltransferase involved in cell wall biosynthesis